MPAWGGPPASAKIGHFWSPGDSLCANLGQPRRGAVLGAPAGPSPSSQMQSHKDGIHPILLWLRVLASGGRGPDQLEDNPELGQGQALRTLLLLALDEHTDRVP